MVSRTDAFLFVMGVDREIAESLGESPLANGVLVTRGSQEARDRVEPADLANTLRSHLLTHTHPEPVAYDDPETPLFIAVAEVHERSPYKVAAASAKRETLSQASSERE